MALHRFLSSTDLACEWRPRANKSECKKEQEIELWLWE